MQFDDILVILGEFGPYQRRVYSVACILVFTTSWVSLIPVFLSASVDHWCAVSEWNNYNCTLSGLTVDECDDAKRNASIPHNLTSNGDLVYEQCLKYNVSGVGFWPGLDPSNCSSGATNPIPCDQGWQYDDSQYKSTTVTDFDLVCGKEGLTQISQSVFYGGYLVGSIVFGILGDIIGRRGTLLITVGLNLATGLLLALSPNLWVFTVIRFFQGCADVSIYAVLFIMGTELVGPSKRHIAGTVIAIPFAVGYMCLAVMAYFLRYWRTLQIVATSPLVFVFAIMLCMPESARWLISAGKYDKAERIIVEIAKVNKATLPDQIFTSDFKMEKVKRREDKRTGLDLFRTRNMRARTINIIFNGMVNAMVYAGLSLNTSNLGVNDYVAFAISGAVEIPAYVLSFFIIEYFGRKPSLCGCLLLGGVACLCAAFVSPGAWLTTVAMIGKFGIAASFAILYLYTTELYPTKIRSIALGVCSMFAHIASMLAPLILILTNVWTPLPLVIYGSLAIIAALLTLFLPETRGQKLPDTLEESENFGKNIQKKNTRGSNGIYTAGGNIDENKMTNYDISETAHEADKDEHCLQAVDNSTQTIINENITQF